MPYKGFTWGRAPPFAVQWSLTVLCMQSYGMQSYGTVIFKSCAVTSMHHEGAPAAAAGAAEAAAPAVVRVRLQWEYAWAAAAAASVQHSQPARKG